MSALKNRKLRVVSPLAEVQPEGDAAGLYQQGYDQSYQEGFNAGFSKGYEDGHKLAYRGQEKQ
ncbi:hypothetical protein DCC85_17555 [Paenibacillus sp. CAA11]|nr:hypothetical protein DCC85_17555 [Paenibacillus sp. CAA11]